MLPCSAPAVHPPWPGCHAAGRCAQRTARRRRPPAGRRGLRAAGQSICVMRAATSKQPRATVRWRSQQQAAEQQHEAASWQQAGGSAEQNQRNTSAPRSAIWNQRQYRSCATSLLCVPAAALEGGRPRPSARGGGAPVGCPPITAGSCAPIGEKKASSPARRPGAPPYAMACGAPRHYRERGTAGLPAFGWRWGRGSCARGWRQAAAAAAAV